jgi:hypothetical protein
MEYIIIFILESAGICFHLIPKIGALCDKYPEKNRKEIEAIFKKEDWDTVALSIVVLVLNLLGHFILNKYAPELIAGIEYYILWAFVGAFGLGYFGQRLIYKVLGTSEKFLNKQIESKLQ